jgi:hypothetical protein
VVRDPIGEHHGGLEELRHLGDRQRVACETELELVAGQLRGGGQLGRDKPASAVGGPPSRCADSDHSRPFDTCPGCGRVRESPRTPYMRQMPQHQ